MAKEKQIINFFVCFMCLITFITAKLIYIDYDSSKEYTEYIARNEPKELTVDLEFKTTIPYYIKVTVTPEEGKPTPNLCFSSSSQSCDSGREALAKRTDGQTNTLFLKREQFQDDSKELYIQVKCLEENCNYSLKFYGGQDAEIGPNTVYSYLVTSATREMRFLVKGEVIEESYLTIGIDGSSSAQLTIDDVDKLQHDFDTGRIVTFPLLKNNGTLATFTIRAAKEGEYINLNVHSVYNNQAIDNFLYPNGPVVMGLLEGSEEGYFREECFPVSSFISEKFKYINKFYLTGRIHSKYALFWLADENGYFMEETEKEISDGQLSFLIETNGLLRYVCFEFSYESNVNMDYVAYSISILEPTKLENIYNFYPPQIVGQMYRRMIPKGGYAVYHGGKIDTSDKRYNYNVYTRKGVVEMYIDKCNTFPYCFYTITEDTNLSKMKQIGKQSIWDTTVEKSGTSGPIESNKNVMIVYCKDEDNENKGYCEVDTSIFIQGQEISLIENEKFSKFVLKGEKGIFNMNLEGGIKTQRLTIDIMVHSGDVSFKLKNEGSKLSNGKLGEEEIDINYYKYYLSNKVFFHFNFAQLQVDGAQIEYTAELNSFFTIQFGMNSYNLNQLEEEVPSGESYLVQIDPTTSEKYKIVYLKNHRLKAKQPFLANFFALNCEFKVTRGENEISFFDGYAQEVLKQDVAGYNSERYEYKINITETDLSNYNHKMCMLYVAGFESRDTSYETEIVVSENVNQQIIFDDDFKTIRFLYPQGDSSKDLAIYFNVIDQAYYKINIYANSETKPFKEYTITRSQIYYIAGTEITNHCPTDTLCSIIVEASLIDLFPKMVKTEPMIEITIRQIKNTPSYLQKSMAKRDFTCGDRLYYLYTDIGKNEIGEVSVNFYRDFGNVWGKVVRKDQTNADLEPNWRGIYRMPSADWEDSLPFNGYTKKFEVGIEQTQDCIEGCYLLLSIQISQIGDYVGDYKFYPFSIISRITPNNYAYTDIPKVVIQVDEFIIGNVDISENERIYQFYEIWIPHDSYRVEFDWQSEVAGLYINVGGTRPTTKNADFKLLPPGRDSLLYLDKFNILEKAKAKKIKIPNENSLQDLNLVIGVWTDKTDSVNTELFSLRVHVPNKDDELDIIEITADQKILCSPHFINDNQFRCLFMVTYDDEDVKLGMPLLVHAASVNQSAVTYTYANFIEREYYDEYQKDYLVKNTPTQQTAEFNTYNEDIDYIYTKLSPDKSGNKKYYLYVNVISDKTDDIMIITSLPMYNGISQDDYEFYPNSNTEQLLSVTVDRLQLKFFTTSSLIVNIVTLGGEAEVTWKKDPNMVYNLRGRGDRLSLTSGTTLDQMVISKRKNSNVKLKDSDEAGFVFYISYYVRNPENNFDEVQYGKSQEIGYRETDLPVYLYSKIGSYFNDLNIAVTFRDSDIDTQGEYDTNNSPLLVKAALTRESTVYRAKQNPELSPSLDNSIFGSYDIALRTVQVFFSNEIIRLFNIKTEENPTLYLSLEKNRNIQDKIYQKFNLEVQFSKTNGAVVPVEKTFNYGTFNGYYTNYYRLKNDKNKKYMIIELAFNSKLLNFAISDSITRYNMTRLITKTEKARGKIFVTIEPEKQEFIYLNIFRNETRVHNNLLLSNYVFKYINVDKEEDFSDFKILDDNNELTYSEKTEGNITQIECTFNKIALNKEEANITYFFKVVDNLTHVYEEEYETIAVMKSPYYTVYERNPADKDGKITLTAKGDLSNWVYLQVIAQIQQDTILEYVAYKGVKILRPPPKEDDNGKEDNGDNKNNNNNYSENSSSTTVFVVIAVILLVLIIGLAVVVFVFQQRNKSLLNQVKHVSFQQNAGGNTNTDPNLLLQKNQS